MIYFYSEILNQKSCRCLQVSIKTAFIRQLLSISILRTAQQKCILINFINIFSCFIISKLRALMKLSNCHSRDAFCMIYIKKFLFHLYSQSNSHKTFSNSNVGVYVLSVTHTNLGFFSNNKPLKF